MSDPFVAGRLPGGYPELHERRILNATEHGDPSAAEHLLPLVYDELERHDAQAAALVKLRFFAGFEH